jgi:O-antigen ligase
MTPDTRDRVVDVAIAAALALFPLLPAGPAYVGLEWPWALDVFFIVTATLGLMVVLTVRPNGGVLAQPADASVRLMRRGYLIWLIPVTAATIVGVLERNPFDGVLLRVEAEGLLGRLMRPMDQAADPFYPLRVGVTCGQGAVVFWLLSAVLERTRRPARRIRAAIHGCLLGLGLASFVAVVQYVTGMNLLEHWVLANPGLTRSHGTLDDPNALASFLVLGIGLAVGVAWSRPGRWAGRQRLGAVLVIALAASALVTTVSRAGWAALLIAAVVFAAALPDTLLGTSGRAQVVRRVARVISFALIGAFVVWAALAATLPKRPIMTTPDTPWEAVLQTIDPRESLETVLKRRHLLWQAALHIASDDWVLGAGLGQFPRLLAGYPGAHGPENAHNYFLQVVAEAGLIGLTGLLLLLLAAALAVRYSARERGPRRTRLAVGLSAGLLAFVLTWLTGHPLLTLSNQLWLACVMAIGLAALQPVRRFALANSSPRSAQGVRQWLLHPALVTGVGLMTLAALVPRLVTDFRDGEAASAAAGVYAWETAPPSESPPGDHTFRWTRSRAALREPIRGAVVTVPLYLARPDIPARSVTLHIRVGGVPVEPVTLAANGWHRLTYDLPTVLGESRWRTQHTITLEFRVDPPVIPARIGSSDDTRELGVGLGVVQWGGSGGGGGGGGI